MHFPSLIEKKRRWRRIHLRRNRTGHLRLYSGRNPRLPDERAGDGNFFPRHERQGDLAFDQSNAGERPDIRVSTKLAAQGRQTLDRRNWRKDFTRSGTAAGLR